MSSLSCRFEWGQWTNYNHSTRTNKQQCQHYCKQASIHEDRHSSASPGGIRMYSFAGWQGTHHPSSQFTQNPPKPRISLVAEVNYLLTWAMADVSSHKSEHSPIVKVATVEAVTSPSQKPKASPQPVNTSSQASVDEAEASLEGLPANISPIAATYSSRSASPPVDPMELQTNANRAADNMLHLKRSTDLKRQSDLGTRGTVASEWGWWGHISSKSLSHPLVGGPWCQGRLLQVSLRGQMQLSSGCQRSQND